MKTVLRVCLMGVLLIIGAELVQAYDHCNTYYNSRIVSSMQYGTYCGSTGDGCEYCWNDNGDGYCYGNLPEGCGIDHQILPW